MAALKMLVSSIRIDGGTQPRASIDQAIVDDYAEAFRRGDELPAAMVFHDGTSYWLADGFHRYHAARSSGLDSLLVEIRNGTQRDAVLYSVSANATHGLRRTNEDKRKAVFTLLTDTEWGQLSDREIAKLCGVSNTFVGLVRHQVSTVDTSTNSNESKTSKPKTAKQLAREAEKQAKREQKKREKEEEKQRRKDLELSQAELVKSLQDALAENAGLHAQIKALSTDDTKAELAKHIRLLNQAETEKGGLQEQLSVANKALRKFGQYFEQLRKLTGAQSNAGTVEAVRVAFQRAA